jgi:hypothetical protein
LRKSPRTGPPPWAIILSNKGLFPFCSSSIFASVIKHLMNLYHWFSFYLLISVFFNDSLAAIKNYQFLQFYVSQTLIEQYFVIIFWFYLHLCTRSSTRIWPDSPSFWMFGCVTPNLSIRFLSTQKHFQQIHQLFFWLLLNLRICHLNQHHLHLVNFCLQRYLRS